MGRIYEFKPRENNSAPIPKNKKNENRTEDRKLLLERLDPISRKLFEEGPKALYGDFDGKENNIDGAKLDREKEYLELLSDDDIIEELADEKNRELIAIVPEFFQAYRERIMGGKKGSNL